MADPSRKGDVAEIQAVSWLLMRGYGVFRNVGCTGPIDLVAIDPMGETHLIDVKAARKSKAKTWDYGVVDTPLTEKQRELGVKLLIVNTATESCYWSDHRT